MNNFVKLAHSQIKFIVPPAPDLLTKQTFLKTSMDGNEFGQVQEFQNCLMHTGVETNIRCKVEVLLLREYYMNSTTLDT